MMIKIHGIEFSYKSQPVLENIMFGVDKKEVLAILGPNGSGKTTLLRCISLISKPKKGIILIEKEDIRNLTKTEIAKKIGYVPQRSETGHIKVFDAVLLGRKPYIKWDVSKQDIEITQRILNKLRLEYLSLRDINKLSGGELQKVAIARALVQEPKVLLLDEPTSNLDLKNQFEILKTIKSIVKKEKISAVVTMHDLNLAIRFADKFIFLKNGKIFASGGKEVIIPEYIKEIYGISVVVKKYNGNSVVIPL